MTGERGLAHWVAPTVKGLGSDSEEQLSRLAYKVVVGAKRTNGGDGEAQRRGSTLTRADRGGRGT